MFAVNWAITFGFFLPFVIPAEPDKPVADPAFVGTWKIDVDRSLKDISEIPHGLNRQFANLDEYRTYVRPKIEHGQFEIHADGTAFYCSGKWTKEMQWVNDGDHKFWVGYRIPFAFSVGHFITIKPDGSGICKFQVDYSETVAPRSPLYVTKAK